MKIDVRTPLLDYRGKPIVEGDNRTFRDFVAIALNNSRNADASPAERKAKSYQITTKLYHSNKVEFTLDDRQFIKEEAEKLLPPLHSGRIVDIIEERESLSILPEEDLTSSPERELGKTADPPPEASTPIDSSKSSKKSGVST